MLKLDILVPIILILCLLALAWILSQVFSPSEEKVDNRANTEIVLDEDRYRENDELGSATNIDDSPANASNTNGSTADLDAYYQDDSEGTVIGDEQEESEPTYYDEDTNNATSAATAPSNTSTTTRNVSSGEYHVFAGSFTQKIYAQQLVRELKRDGFADAYVGYTNRGKFAVAVAGSSNRYSTAKQLSDRVKGKGYEAFVKKGG